MIDKLTIKNFKCFHEAEIRLGNLTFFCGFNSAGKSAAIQALLYLAHNSQDYKDGHIDSRRLSLNAFSTAANFTKNAKQFEISVEKNNEKFKVDFAESTKNPDNTKITKIQTAPEIEELLDYRNKHIFDLPAKRAEYRDCHLKNFDRFNALGNEGEFVIDYFAKNQEKRVHEKRLKDKSSNTLSAQVNYWLNKILNVRLKVENDILNSFAVSFLYGNSATKFIYKNNKAVSPRHIGTGISPVVGVIVSCLAAEQGDIVIIENPEMYLHPKAQSDLADFFCFIANSGVQIIIESHSDHIFNGIRKAVAAKTIKKEQVIIQFFELDDEYLSQNKEIELSDNGRVVEHVKGLFDQFDNDLDYLLEL